MLAVVPVAAEEDNRLAFRPIGGETFAFDTGTLRGTLKLDDRWQGISSMVHVPTGEEMILSAGIFSYYRVFAAGERFGNGARDWPTPPVEHRAVARPIERAGAGRRPGPGQTRKRSWAPAHRRRENRSAVAHGFGQRKYGGP